MPMFGDAAKYAAYQVKKHAKNIVKHPIKGPIKATHSAIKGTVDGIADAYAESTVDVGAKLGKAAFKGFTKKVEPGIENFYTGRKESALGVGAAWVVAGTYGTMKYGKDTQFGPKPGTVSYGGTAPIMDADGVSSTTNAPTLNATGNMVFGLHQARKG